MVLMGDTTHHQLEAGLKGGTHRTTHSVVILEHVVYPGKERLQGCPSFRQIDEEIGRFG